MRMPSRIDECWTIEGAEWVQKTHSPLFTQPVDRTEGQILELEAAARADFWALGSTPAERRAALVAKCSEGLTRIGAIPAEPRRNTAPSEPSSALQERVKREGHLLKTPEPV